MAEGVAALRPGASSKPRPAPGIVTERLAAAPARGRDRRHRPQPGDAGRGRARVVSREVSFQPADAQALPFPTALRPRRLPVRGHVLPRSRRRLSRSPARAATGRPLPLQLLGPARSDNPVSARSSPPSPQLFPGDPPSFLNRVPFGYHDKARIEADLRAAGFRTLRSRHCRLKPASPPPGRRPSAVPGHAAPRRDRTARCRRLEERRQGLRSRRASLSANTAMARAPRPRSHPRLQRGLMPHERIVGLYEENAAAWDEMRGREFPERQWFAPFLSLPAGASILDLGCGSGEPVAGTSSRAATGSPASIPRPSLIAMCRERFPEAGVAGRRHARARPRPPLRRDPRLVQLLPPALRRSARDVPRFAAHAAQGAPLMFTSGSAARRSDRRMARRAALPRQPVARGISVPAGDERIRGAELPHGRADCPQGPFVWLARYRGPLT
jgi:hypothetical protein